MQEGQSDCCLVAKIAQHKLLGIDILASVLTGNDLSLLPLQGQAMIGGLVLTPGFSEVYTATDENGALVGYIICTPPGHLLFSKYVISDPLRTECSYVVDSAKRPVVMASTTTPTNCPLKQGNIS